jgi:Spy/CpxP family protein refolding chaperone
MVFAADNRKALALIALVFVLGVALGAVGHSVADRRVLGARTRQLQPRPNPPRAVARLTTELGLTPDQQKQVGDILADTQRRFDEVREQIDPQLVHIREQGRDQIRQVLSPEQRPKFEDFLKRLDEERRRRAAGQSGATTNANPNR